MVFKTMTTPHVCIQIPILPGFCCHFSHYKLSKTYQEALVPFVSVKDAILVNFLRDSDAPPLTLTIQNVFIDLLGLSRAFLVGLHFYR